MTEIRLVLESIRRKKSNEEEARRLMMDLTKYMKIKNAIMKVWNKGISPTDITNFEMAVQDELINPTLVSFMPQKATIDSFEEQEDLERGTKKISTISDNQPRSVEEIIKILKIDTKKWKLSQYWNKEKDNKWVVSALVTKIPDSVKAKEEFIEALKSHQPVLIPIVDTRKYMINTANTEKVCGVLSLQDLHFGKGDSEELSQQVHQAATYLMDKLQTNYNVERVILILGPDTLNMDTFSGTTTSGTPVENQDSAVNAYLKAFDALCNTIYTVKHYCKNLTVMFIPGNHDRLSSFHLVHAVSQVFKNWGDIDFDTDYKERKIYSYGYNMLCFAHGDVTIKNTPLLYAVEHPKEWGNSKHRVLYTGHYHSRKSIEVLTESEDKGFITKSLPALTGTDYWHYHHGFVGAKRSAILHVHEYNKGLVGEFTYNV